MRRLALATSLSLLVACQPAPQSVPRPAANTPAVANASVPFAFEEADIATLQKQMAEGSLSSRALTQAYLDRIAAIDDAGPTLNAVIETNPDALGDADALDADCAAPALPRVPRRVRDPERASDGRFRSWREGADRVRRRPRVG